MERRADFTSHTRGWNRTNGEEVGRISKRKSACVDQPIRPDNLYYRPLDAVRAWLATKGFLLRGGSFDANASSRQIFSPLSLPLQRRRPVDHNVERRDAGLVDGDRDEESAVFADVEPRVLRDVGVE